MIRALVAAQPLVCPMQPTMRPTREGWAMREGTVLVVDDDASIVELLEVALEGRGYEVLTAVNGTAVQVARERRPDVILLDVNMPGMDGEEVSRRLRTHPATAA